MLTLNSHRFFCVHALRGFFTPRERLLFRYPISSPRNSSPSGGPAAMANSFKDRGNEAYQAGEYETALHLYTKGIEEEPTNPALFSNRSAAYLKLQDYGKAKLDADFCIELDKKWSKVSPRHSQRLCQHASRASTPSPPSIFHFGCSVVIESSSRVRNAPVCLA